MPAEPGVPLVKSPASGDNLQYLSVFILKLHN